MGADQGTIYWVYILFPRKRDPDIAKIGFTKNLEKRIAQISSASGRDLCCIWRYRCESKNTARFIEKGMHGVFKNQRVFGEWFNAGDEFTFLLKDLFNKKHGEFIPRQVSSGR